jgi:hypothetical protein
MHVRAWDLVWFGGAPRPSGHHADRADAINIWWSQASTCFAMAKRKKANSLIMLAMRGLART